jgi:hypothetical protein
VVFADSEEVDADLVGKDTLLDEVPDRPRMRQRAIVVVVSDVAEGVEAEDQGERLSGCCGHVESLSSMWIW